jgi:DNA-binding NarL/FixJ family response regulator
MEHAIGVLIAENRVRARAGLRALLSTWPEIEVVGDVANGQEAVAFVARNPPDVVLLDIQMPVMDGLEATRRIKAQWPEVAVIVVTMNWTDRAKAMEAGADAFLSKAALPEEWLPLLRNVMASDTR